MTTPAAGETNSFAHLGDGVYRRNWWINYTGTGCVRLEVVLNDGSVRSAIVRVVHQVQRRLAVQQAELTNYIYKQHGRY